MRKQPFSKDILVIKDITNFTDSIVSKFRKDVVKVLKRRGGVIGISGGIDSSVTMALAVKAFGSDRVLGVMLPEKDSSPDSLDLARELADKFGVKYLVEDISGALEGFGCYSRRDEAIKRVFPEFDPKRYKSKIGIDKSSMKRNLPPVFHVTIIDEDNQEKKTILPVKEYLQIVAASNFKQRSRMSMLYYHGEANHFAVLGTANKHEINQGFFVKYGDGGVDVIPIAGLYKTQVYQLAEYLGVPQKIIDRTPTTDTYTAEQSQEEFFYQLPFEQLDLIWYGFENGYEAKEVGKVMGQSEEDIEKIYKNFSRKQRTTEYLRMKPIIDY
jgi:NAD+ synthase